MEDSTEIETTSEHLVKDKFVTVTTFSKYLAMLLFITLPFIGGWIGYTYAPVKVVEVEKIVYSDKESNSGISSSKLSVPTERRNVVETGYKDGYTYLTQPDGSVINDRFIFESHDGVLVEVPEDIASRFDKERLSAGIFPLKKGSENTIFLSTTKNTDLDQNDKTWSRTNRIYEFNLETFELAQKIEFKNNKDLSLRIIATEDDLLIVHPALLELSGGPCTNNWADFKDNLYSINTLDYGAGLSPYSPPQHLIKEGIEWQEECMKTLDSY